MQFPLAAGNVQSSWWFRLVVVAVIAGGALLFEWLRWVERTGRIKPSNHGRVTRGADALFELQSLLEPSKKNVVVAKMTRRKEDAGDAGPDIPRAAR